MPAPKPSSLTTRFLALEQEGIRLKERDDCAVIALAVVADLSYVQARRLLAEVGREDGGSVYMFHIRAALSKLGFRLVERQPQEFIGLHYPLRCREVFKSITTHHPDRFPEAWRCVDRAILDLPEHVSGVRNGVIHDYVRGRRLRVDKVYLVKEKDMT
jgi:hypothetical protein